MGNELIDASAKVVVEYKNQRPLDLLDLTASLTALGKQYRRHVAVIAGDKARARLYVGRLETGSVIATLIPLLELADAISKNTDLVGGFVANYGDLLNTLKSFPPKARELPKSDIRGAKTFVRPIAIDTGSQVNITALTGSNIVLNTFNIGSNGAQDVCRHADIALAGLPSEDSFQSEPMVLYQMRDGPAGSTGDYGKIDRFGTQPVKLLWASETVKEDVLNRPENVFDLIYYVSGIAKTADGKLAAYRIHRLDDVAFKPDEERHG